LSTLAATELAVILVADEPTELHQLRVAPLRRIAESLRHVDFAPIHWRVQGLSVLQETMYPSLACKELLTIDFRSTPRR
jgi:hypothetical protein